MCEDSGVTACIRALSAYDLITACKSASGDQRQDVIPGQSAHSDGAEFASRNSCIVSNCQVGNYYANVFSSVFSLTVITCLII